MKCLWCVMCILGGAGYRGEHFCSALSKIHVRCVVDAVACHPKPPARLKHLPCPSGQESWLLTATMSSLGISVLPSKGAVSPKIICPLVVSPHPTTGLWVGSKTSPLVLIRTAPKGRPSPRSLCGISFDLSHNDYIPSQPLPLPNSVSLIHSLPGVSKSTTAPCPTLAQ